ncbi:MAG: RIP metalloprotease RseP [Candidatus Marinimicrobia bacterium]|jgi:regulator of sigma E protease|nr:RIP metalloprotease RseP [Candidatus Neomarinimicrobiota bacterium]MBT3617413.1 RIP metalloprotease RseP [Candidatus Neomarinimicrobiota bacterium]MBT3829353.1 RIP metalloprotease RseP [Candidatus Neomarinimicrobiota bacterium]MBT3997636.1 RIP metalloprotease RseP [Candidatus Neomarinimicrobiota bacterium]MBT4280934.1 RIP metalloprotease RseP [Candidatus Neomarinimicrobiota bacterium]
MTTLWATIFVLGILVLVHELGHYLAARSVGVRVDRFSIGFPPRLITFTSVDNGWNFNIFFYKRDESGKLIWSPIIEKFIASNQKIGSGTEYCLALIPFGGYVKMAGTIDESLDSEIENKPYELMSKSHLAQTWVMSAGILMNILLAFILFTGVSWHTGLPEAIDAPVVHEVISNLPAEKAGLLIGDKITAIDDAEINSWSDLSEVIHLLPNTEISLEWERDGSILTKQITTSFQVNPATGDTLGAIGILPEIIYNPINFQTAASLGFLSTVNGFGMIINTLRMLFSGQASPKELGGPIMIAKLAGKFAERGWVDLLVFMALISVNLAFINILPIPGLDGGHILITIIEVVIRRPLTIKTRMLIQQVGMVFLLLLMATVFFNDFSRLLGN